MPKTRVEFEILLSLFQMPLPDSLQGRAGHTEPLTVDLMTVTGGVVEKQNIWHLGAFLELFSCRGSKILVGLKTFHLQMTAKIIKGHL